MPLTAFMKTSDPNRVSTITPDLNDISRRRKLYLPLRAVGKDVYEKIFVADCQTHVGGVSIPVHILRKVGDEWIDQGIGKCCPLCWRMVVGPDGEIDPPVKPLTGLDVDPIMKRPKKERRAATTKAQKTTTSVGTNFNVKLISLWAKTMGEFDTYQVMEHFNVSRSVAVAVLKIAVKLHQLEETVGAGRGNRTIYRLPQENEA